MKTIVEPRDDNPRMEKDKARQRIRLVCTDCTPEVVVTDRDVSCWNVMTPEMVERHGELSGAEDMLEWINHMGKVHGIRPDFKWTNA